MSKDKAGKKDKLKHLDLFDMMLKQSQVFRDMVEHFQSAWAPHAPSVVVEASVATSRPTGERASAGKAAPVAKPAGKTAARKTTARKTTAKKAAVASTKPAPAAVRKSPRKSAGKAAATPGKPRPVTSRKAAGKPVAASRVAKKK